MGSEKFEKCLLLYGVDFNKWPEPEKYRGMESLLNSSELQDLYAEQKKLEKFLRLRKFEEANDNLEERIISSSLNYPKRSFLILPTIISKFLNKIFNLSKRSVIPEIFIIIGILILGFIIGFVFFPDLALLKQKQTRHQEFSYFAGFEGNVLWKEK